MRANRPSATCCTTSPRAVILAKCAARSAAFAALSPAITGPENRISLYWIFPSVRSSRVISESPAGTASAGKQRRKLRDRLRPEPQRRQIVHVVAGVASQRDRGQKQLQRLILFGVVGLFLVLHFLQPEVVLQAALDGIVQRQLQRLAGHRLRGHAAPEGILAPTTGSAPVRTRLCRRPSQESRPARLEAPTRRKMFLSFHFH